MHTREALYNPDSGRCRLGSTASAAFPRGMKLLICRTWRDNILVLMTRLLRTKAWIHVAGGL